MTVFPFLEPEGCYDAGNIKWSDDMNSIFGV